MPSDFDNGPITVPGIPVVISGPSGVGKESVIAALVENHQEIFVSVSMTTRQPRPGERDGVDYIFVDRPAFLHQIEEGTLFEWAEVYGELYGTPKAPLIRNLEADRDVVLALDVQGGLNLRSQFASACLVFLLPPSRDELVRRLRSRGTESEEEIERRLALLDYELTFLHHYDYLVVNRSVDQAAKQVWAIILAERCRRERVEPVLRNAGILRDVSHPEADN